MLTMLNHISTASGKPEIESPCIGIGIISGWKITQVARFGEKRRQRAYFRRESRGRARQANLKIPANPREIPSPVRAESMFA